MKTSSLHISSSQAKLTKLEYELLCWAFYQLWRFSLLFQRWCCRMFGSVVWCPNVEGWSDPRHWRSWRAVGCQKVKEDAPKFAHSFLRSTTHQDVTYIQLINESTNFPSSSTNCLYSDKSVSLLPPSIACALVLFCGLWNQFRFSWNNNQFRFSWNNNKTTAVLWVYKDFPNFLKSHFH